MCLIEVTVFRQYAPIGGVFLSFIEIFRFVDGSRFVIRFDTPSLLPG